MTNDSESKRLGDTDSSCVMMCGEVSTTSGSSGVAGIIFSLNRHRIHTKIQHFGILDVHFHIGFDDYDNIVRFGIYNIDNIFFS